VRRPRLFFPEPGLLHPLLMPVRLAEDEEHHPAPGEAERDQGAEADPHRLVKLVSEDVGALDHGSSSGRVSPLRVASSWSQR
jgi:hypothetical protein